MIRISSSARTWLSAAMLATVLAGCTRDESETQKKGPIEVASLPTPKTTVRVAQALPTPVPAHTAGAPAPTAATAPKAPTAAAEPTAVPAKPEKTAAAPPEKEETPKQAAASAAVAKKGVVGRGTDLLAGPASDAKVRGTFQGRTDVDVLETDGAYSHVQAPVVGGGSVEGWVLSSAVQAPGAKPAVVAKTDKPADKAAPTAGGETKAPAVSGAKPAAAKPPAAAPAKSGGGESKGPSDILLKALAGMAAKRPGTPFTHKKHYDDYGVKCVDCHHAVKAKGGAVPATKTCTDAGCHLADQCNGQPVPKKNDACPAFEDAYHKNCIDCHRQQSGPTKCAECHTG